MAWYLVVASLAAAHSAFMNLVRIRAQVARTRIKTKIKTRIKTRIKATKE
jgi:hypothetical protein